MYCFHGAVEFSARRLIEDRIRKFHGPYPFLGLPALRFFTSFNDAGSIVQTLANFFAGKRPDVISAMTRR